MATLDVALQGDQTLLFFPTDNARPIPSFERRVNEHVREFLVLNMLLLVCEHRGAVSEVGEAVWAPVVFSADEFIEEVKDILLATIPIPTNGSFEVFLELFLQVS